VFEPSVKSLCEGQGRNIRSESKRRRLLAKPERKCVRNGL
jgi:hypothetical protein